MSDRELTDRLIPLLGGAGNIRESGHCMTRIRLSLADRSRADLDGIKALPGVLGARNQGDETQIVIGNDVARVHAEFERSRTRLAGTAPTVTVADDATGGDRGGAGRDLFGRFLSWLSGIFFPIVPALAGSGLIKTALSILTTLGWMSAESPEYRLLYLISDVVLYFLPFMLAVSAGRKTGTSVYTALCLAGALMYPTLIAAATAGEEYWTFLGAPLRIVNYSSTVIPIILTVWLAGYVERWLERHLPAVLRVMCLTGIVLLVMVPLELTIIGPAGSYLGDAIAAGIAWLFAHTSVLAGVLLGAFQGPMVLTGTHLTEIPLIVQELAANGGTIIMPVTMMANMALAGGLLAVALKGRLSPDAPLFWSVTISGLAGISEPGLYGVATKFRRLFYASIIGGALGGGIVAISGFLQPAVASLGVLTPVLFLTADASWGYLVATIVSFVVTFALTLLWVPRRDLEAVTGASEAAQRASETAEVVVRAPADGIVRELASVPDAMFANGTMGQGVAFLASDEVFGSPISGEVVAVAATGHAIGLRADDGTEILMHIGINTVGAAGAGFLVLVDQGDRVEAGDAVVRIDREVLAAAGYAGDALIAPIVIINRPEATLSVGGYGAVKAGGELFAVSAQTEEVAR